jgi:hypothetical protein
MAYLISNRRVAEKAPGLPAESLARTRHHILVTGSVLVENVEAVTFWVRTRGEENVSESSIWSV